MSVAFVDKQISFIHLSSKSSLCLMYMDWIQTKLITKERNVAVGFACHKYILIAKFLQIIILTNRLGEKGPEMLFFFFLLKAVI